jgi:hypothetical protein
MPPILLVCLSKGRVESTDDVTKGLVVHTLHTALLGTGEYPGVLLSTPEQCCFLMGLLAFCAPQWSTEWAYKLPLLCSTIRRYFSGTFQTML